MWTADNVTKNIPPLCFPHYVFHLTSSDSYHLPPPLSSPILFFHFSSFHLFSSSPTSSSPPTFNPLIHLSFPSILSSLFSSSPPISPIKQLNLQVSISTEPESGAVSSSSSTSTSSSPTSFYKKGFDTFMPGLSDSKHQAYLIFRNSSKTFSLRDRSLAFYLRIAKYVRYGQWAFLMINRIRFCSTK